MPWHEALAYTLTVFMIVMAILCWMNSGLRRGKGDVVGSAYSLAASAFWLAVAALILAWIR